MSKDYMNAYMTKRYQQNPTKSKMYRNSLRMRDTYEIDDECWSQYKHNLYNVVKIIELFNELPDDVVDQVINNRKELTFRKKSAQ